MQVFVEARKFKDPEHVRQFVFVPAEHVAQLESQM